MRRKKGRTGPRNAAARSLKDHPPRIVRARKGKGSYQRRPRHQPGGVVVSPEGGAAGMAGAARVGIAVILAGGRSRRMGGDKALVRLGGARLIDRVIARIAPQAERLLIAGPLDYGTGIAAVADLPGAPEGPAAAIYSVAHFLAAEGSDAAGFLTVPVDGPFLPADLAARLASRGGAAVASDGAEDHPVFAFWPLRALAGAWPHLLGRPHVSLKALAEACAAERVLWPEADLFLNINTQADLDRAEALLRRSAP